MRQGVGMLEAELMRIKAEGDYAAIKALVDRYGVRFDPKLRDQVVARYQKLNLPRYWCGINPLLTPGFDAAGKLTAVKLLTRATMSNCSSVTPLFTEYNNRRPHGCPPESGGPG